MKKYKLISILFVIFVIFFVLMSLLVGCNKNSLPSGNLKIKTIDAHTLDVYYSYNNTTNVVLLRGVSAIASFGSGSDSGVYRDDELNPNTSYIYGLLGNDTILTSIVGRTSSH